MVWGSAADAYADHTSNQQTWVAALAAADLRVAEILAKQAELVALARLDIAITLGARTGGMMVATALTAAG